MSATGDGSRSVAFLATALDYHYGITHITEWGGQIGLDKPRAV